MLQEYAVKEGPDGDTLVEIDAQGEMVEPGQKRTSRVSFAEMGNKLGRLVEDKNAAYGDSFNKCGEFLRLCYPEGIKPDQYEDALGLVRVFDKQMRIATSKKAFGESPWKDIAGYGILGAVRDQD